MIKIIEKIKQKDIDVFFVILIIVTILSFYRRLVPYDNFWLFSFIYKMHIGYEIYNDINVIITPLFFVIGKNLFNILGANFVTFAFYNILISTTLFMLIYKIFKALGVARRRGIFFTIAIMWFFHILIAGGANYNILAIVPILISVLLILKNKETKRYIIGILCFITFLIKQNIGIYFLIGIVLYELVSNRAIKEKIKRIIAIGTTLITLLLSFIIILSKKGMLYSFIDYCFLGIGEFAKKNILMSKEPIVFFVLLILIVLVYAIIIYRKKSNIDSKIKDNLKLLLCIGVPLLLIAYPIFNHYHIYLSSIILCIAVIYLLEQTLISGLLNNRKKEKAIYLIIIIIFIIYITSLLIIAYTDDKYTTFNKESIYYGILCDKEMYDEINNVCEYIRNENNKGIDVKVLSYKSNLYMNLLNKNNKEFDLPFLGNLGKDGEDGLINQIKQLKNTKILIQTDKEYYTIQESEKVRKYIQENYEKQGKIEKYDIYYIK